MEKIFSDSTVADVEANLYYDTLRNKEKMQLYLIIGVIVIIFIFRGFIGYWLKFGVAIPSGVTQEKINVENDPIQINYTPEEQKAKTFTYKSLLNKHKIKIIPQAHYELSGLVVAYNHDFFFVNDFFDSAALYDLGASWGELGRKIIYKKYFKCYSQKNEITGSRILWTEWNYNMPFTENYAISHWSHSHLVPANRNVMAALLKLKRWENVKIEGELIDMQYVNKRGLTENYHTSTVRNDPPQGNRGNGSCETVYVKKVQIGNLIYQ